METSKLHAHFPAGKSAPLNLKPEQAAAAFRDLHMLGIGLDEAELVKMADHAISIAMDANQALITTASIPNPIQFLQQWMPGFVRIISAARKIDDLIGMSVIGNWEDEEMVQGVMEPTGTAVPYADYSNVPLASWNLNWERRTVVRFEQGLRVGTLEEKRAARAQVNSAAEKRISSALALEIIRNSVGFSGYNSGNNRTYGFLNDPGLPNYVNVAAGAVGSMLWSKKTFLEITADIRTAVVALRTQSQDTIDPESVDLTLALPTNAVDRLTVVSDFGISVRDWMKQTYPRMRVASAPQLNTANGGAGVFYLYANNIADQSTDGGRVWEQMVPAKFQVLGVAQIAKGYEEDYSNATAGVMLKRPWALVRYSGIS